MPLLFLYLLQCLVGPPSPSPVPGPDPLTQNAWVMAFGVPASGITQVDPKGAYFDFPANSTSNYFLHSVAAPMAGTLSVSIAVVASSGAIFQKAPEATNTCTSPPPSAHLFFSSASAGADGSEYHRWWAKTTLSGAAYTLANGTAVLSMLLSPVNWIDVNGISGDANPTATAGFADALANAKYIGVTFGGGCFYGHGVSVSGGTAQFQVLDYSVQ